MVYIHPMLYESHENGWLLFFPSAQTMGDKLESTVTERYAYFFLKRLSKSSPLLSNNYFCDYSTVNFEKQLPYLYFKKDYLIFKKSVSNVTAFCAFVQGRKKHILQKYYDLEIWLTIIRMPL